MSYAEALSLAAVNPGQVNLVTLQQKVQALSPVPARELAIPEVETPEAVDVEPVIDEFATPEEQED